MATQMEVLEKGLINRIKPIDYFRGAQSLCPSWDCLPGKQTLTSSRTLYKTTDPYRQTSTPPLALNVSQEHRAN